MRTLPLAEIEAELAHGLDLLATTLRDLPPRHRSMTATFDHSWRLLRPAERGILRQLSIFRGGFTRAAAAAVTGATVADLAGLADASWLRVGPDGRYEVHELTRQYCAEKLEGEHAREAGETPDQVRDRYADYFHVFAVGTRGGFGGRLTMIGQIAPELDNLLAARDWHVAHVNVDAAIELIRMFGWYGYRMGWYASLFSSLERNISQLESQRVNAGDEARPLERALLLGALHSGLADCHLMWGAGDRAMPHLRQAQSYLAQGPLDDLRWRGERWLRGRTLAFAQEFQGEFAEAMRLWETLRSELSDPLFQLYPYNTNRKLRSRAETYWGQAGAAWRLGQYALAQRLCEESLSISTQCGWEWGQGVARKALAWTYLMIGAYHEAEAEARAALNIMRSYGDRPFTADFYNVLGVVYCALGNYEQASICHRRSLALARTLALDNPVGYALRGLAAISLAQGRPVAARQLFEHSLAAFERAGTSWVLGPMWTHVGLGQVALAMRDLAGARQRFRSILSVGRSAAVYLAQTLAGMAEVELGEGRLERVLEVLLHFHRYTAGLRARRCSMSCTMPA